MVGEDDGLERLLPITQTRARATAHTHTHTQTAVFLEWCKGVKEKEIWFKVRILLPCKHDIISKLGESAKDGWMDWKTEQWIRMRQHQSLVSRWHMTPPDLFL